MVLYLVNAAEKPGEAGYVAPRWEDPAWIGKPVLVLLNQAGEPRPGAADEADEAQWRRHLAPYPFVRQILPLDAFACAGCRSSPSSTLPLSACPGPATAWPRPPSWPSASAAWTPSTPPWPAAWPTSSPAPTRQRSPARGRPRQHPAAHRRRRRHRLRHPPQQQASGKPRRPPRSRDPPQGTDQLIELHGLGGRAPPRRCLSVRRRLLRLEKIGESSAAPPGGVIRRPLRPCCRPRRRWPDLGAGAVIGAIAGAVGSAGAAHAANRLRGIDDNRLHWSTDSLSAWFTASLLRYIRRRPLRPRPRRMAPDAPAGTLAGVGGGRSMEVREELAKAWPDGTMRPLWRGAGEA